MLPLPSQPRASLSEVAALLASLPPHVRSPVLAAYQVRRRCACAAETQSRIAARPPHARGGSEAPRLLLHVAVRAWALVRSPLGTAPDGTQTDVWGCGSWHRAGWGC